MSYFEIRHLRDEFASHKTELQETLDWVKKALVLVLKGQHHLAETLAAFLPNFNALLAAVQILVTEISNLESVTDQESQNIATVVTELQAKINAGNTVDDLQPLQDAIDAANLNIAKAKDGIASALDEHNKTNANLQAILAPATATTPVATGPDPSDSNNTDANSTATNGSSTPGSLNNTISNPGSLTAPDTSQPSTVAESTAADTPGFVPTSSTGTTGAAAAATSNVTSDNGDPIPDASKSDTGTTNTVTG